MSRPSRRRFALLAMLGILFAQFSLMAYACPKEAGGALVAAMGAMIDCDEMVTTGPDANLCELHCQDVVKSSVPASGDEVPPAMGAYSVTPLAVAAIASPPRRANDRHPALATAPPLAVRYCRFLI